MKDCEEIRTKSLAQMNSDRDKLRQQEIKENEAKKKEKAANAIKKKEADDKKAEQAKLKEEMLKVDKHDWSIPASAKYPQVSQPQASPNQFQAFLGYVWPPWALSHEKRAMSNGPSIIGIE